MQPWSRYNQFALAGVLVAGVLIRLILLPTEGLRGDIDQFVGWVHHVATEGLASLYSGTAVGPVSFGPVIAYVWAVLSAIQPAFANVTDAADSGIRALMKLPASLADIGLAGVVVFGVRDRPRWAIAGAAAILLHPAVIYVSAWWGQYESIFVLSALGAAAAAVKRRNGLAAALVVASLMTKPQAAALLLPFAAWFWATGYAASGVRGGTLTLVRAGLIGAATFVVLWLPFLPAGGPVRYVQGLGIYQSDVFRILSLRAWNPWWLLQEGAGGQFLADDTAVLGPLTPRLFGYVLTALLSFFIAAAIIRAPRPQVLILGLTASVLIVFTFMTQMHERYSYAALVFPVLLLSHARVRWWWLAFGVTFFVNLLAAIPPSPEIGGLLPVFGPLGVAGSVTMTALCLWVVILTRRESLSVPGDYLQGVVDGPRRRDRHRPTKARRYQRR